MLSSLLSIHTQSFLRRYSLGRWKWKKKAEGCGSMNAQAALPLAQLRKTVKGVWNYRLAPTKGTCVIIFAICWSHLINTAK